MDKNKITHNGELEKHIKRLEGAFIKLSLKYYTYDEKSMERKELAFRITRISDKITSLKNGFRGHMFQGGESPLQGN